MVRVWAKLIGLAGAGFKQDKDRGINLNQYQQGVPLATKPEMRVHRNGVDSENFNQQSASQCTRFLFCFRPDRIDEQPLRKQKLRLALLRACRVLVGSQDYLRQILSQPVASEVLAATAAAEGGGVQSAEGDDGPAGVQAEAPGVSAGPNMLMQILMSAATQPSPIKAIFSRAELEVRVTETPSTSCSAELDTRSTATLVGGFS